MTGHHAGHHPRNAAPAADHRLDQFAAEVNEARANNPAIAALADEEQRLIDEALDIGAHLDRATLGAAWVLLGRLMFQRLQSTPPDQQPVMLGTLFQAARLAGARLYTGDRLPVEMRCPYTYTTGAPCKTVIKAPNSERAEVLLNAHAWQAHPGQERPVSPELAEQVREGIAEAERGETVDLGDFAKHLDDEAESIGLCAECGCEVYLDEDGRIGWHPAAPAGSVVNCPGSGTKPLDGEAQG